MPIRFKLFISIGILFLLVAFTSYFLPGIFVKKDVDRVHHLFSDEIALQNKNGRELWQKLFNERLNQSVIAINTTLAHVATSTEMMQALDASFTKEKEFLWKLLNQLIGENPGIGFLQISNHEKSIAIALNNAQFYTVEGNLLSDHMALFYLQSEVEPITPFGPLLGIRFPLTHALSKQDVLFKGDQSRVDIQELKESAYYLYPLDVLEVGQKSLKTHSLKQHEELKEKAFLLESQLKAANIQTPQAFFEWQKKQSQGLVSSKLAENSEMVAKIPSLAQPTRQLESASRMNIVREYVTVLLDSIQSSPLQKGMPIGGATLYDKTDKSYLGGALLNKDLFFDTFIYNPDSYYKENEPTRGHTLLATQVDLIESPKLSKYLIANTVPISQAEFKEDHVQLKSNPTYLTAGQSLFGDIRSTSLIVDAYILFFDDQGQFLKAISQSKDVVSDKLFAHVSYDKIQGEKVGQIEIDGTPYSFFQLIPNFKLPIHSYVLIPSSSEPMFRLQDVVNENMISIYHALSSQLFATSLLLLLIALFLLSYLSKRITKPITILAAATENIAKGKYFDVRLPKKDNHHDEVSVLTNSFSNMVCELQDKEKIRNLLDKVVSKEIAAEILKGNVQLGGESRIVTILFADIRGFTRLTEQIDPEIVISHLNNYMTVMSDIIEKEGGVIDKYIGDEIMALYGAPVAMEDGAKRAIMTALKMMQELKAWNEIRKAQNKIPIEIGIGIHTGKVVAGNMGADKRLNYTVLGANVNLAARLCSAAGPMEIRISEATLNQSGLKEELPVKSLPPEIFKGFSSPQITYSILS